MALDGLQFWKRIDAMNIETLKELCEKNNIDYKRVMHNRTDCRIPKAEDLLAFAYGLNTTIEYLLTGENEKTVYPERIQRIINSCINASEEDLALVERVLRIEPVIGKKSSSSGALA